MARQPSPTCQATTTSGGIGSGVRLRMLPIANRIAAANNNAIPMISATVASESIDPSKTAMPPMPRMSATASVSVGRMPASGHANSVAQIGMV